MSSSQSTFSTRPSTTSASTSSAQDAKQTTVEPNLDSAGLETAIHKLLTLVSDTEKSKIKNFLTALLLPEVDLAKIKETVLLPIKKSQAVLAPACEELAYLFYAFADKGLKETLILNAIDRLLKGNSQSTPEKKSDFRGEGSLRPIYANAFMLENTLAAYEMAPEFLEKRKDFKPLYLQLKQFLQSLQKSNAGLSQNETTDPEEKFKSTYVEGMTLLQEVRTIIVTLSRQDPAGEGSPMQEMMTIKGGLLQALVNVVNFYPHFPHAALLRAEHMLSVGIIINEVEKHFDAEEGSLATLQDALSRMLHTATLTVFSNPSGARDTVKQIFRKAGYQPREKLKDNELLSTYLSAFRMEMESYEVDNGRASLESLAPQVRARYVKVCADVIQLLRNAEPIDLQKRVEEIYTDLIDPFIVMLMQCYQVQRHTAASDMRDDVKKAAFLEARQSLSLFIDFVTCILGVEPVAFKFSAKLEQLLNKAFPVRLTAEAPGIFDLACLEHQKIERVLKSLGYEARTPQEILKEQQLQEKELEDFLQACEQEDKRAREDVKKKMESDKKNKKKKKKTPTNAQEDKEAKSSEMPAATPREEKLLFDREAAPGKFFLQASALIQTKQYPEALTHYQSAFEAAKAAGDHVIATAAILEQAECLMGQAKIQLLKIQNLLQRIDAEAPKELEIALVTVWELQQKAVLEAQKSLHYFQEKLQPDAASISKDKLHQVEHLSLAIKTVLENAQVKLGETQAYVKAVRDKARERLDILIEGRRFAKERLGAYWNTNPAPLNKFREVQQRFEKRVQACELVSARLTELTKRLQAPLNGYMLLHPAPDQARIEAPHAESALVPAGGMSFVDRIKTLETHLKLEAPVPLGEWTKKGNGVFQGANQEKTAEKPRQERKAEQAPLPR